MRRASKVKSDAVAVAVAAAIAIAVIAKAVKSLLEPKPKAVKSCHPTSRAYNSKLPKSHHLLHRRQLRKQLQLRR